MASGQLQQALPQDAIDELKAVIAGEIVLPPDAGYNAARRLQNPRSTRTFSAIIYCAREEDIRHCLAAVRRFAVEFRVRSGGHSTAGYSASDGVLIDVGRIDQIAVDAVQKTAVAGCGCKLPRLISEIGQHRLDLPLGGGSTVRIGGFVQGGGWGLTSRLFGMNCDSMIEARIMLANGRIVLADETTNYDLWWAMRGGTGGNFGVLLTAKNALHETPDLTSWEVRWELGKPGSSAWLNEAKALAVLQTA